MENVFDALKAIRRQWKIAAALVLATAGVALKVSPVLADTQATQPPADQSAKVVKQNLRVITPVPGTVSAKADTLLKIAQTVDPNSVNPQQATPQKAPVKNNQGVVVDFAGVGGVIPSTANTYATGGAITATVHKGQEGPYGALGFYDTTKKGYTQSGLTLTAGDKEFYGNGKGVAYQYGTWVVPLNGNNGSYFLVGASTQYGALLDPKEGEFNNSGNSKGLATGIGVKIEYNTGTKSAANVQAKIIQTVGRRVAVVGIGDHYFTSNANNGFTSLSLGLVFSLNKNVQINTGVSRVIYDNFPGSDQNQLYLNAAFSTAPDNLAKARNDTTPAPLPPSSNNQTPKQQLQPVPQ